MKKSRLIFIGKLISSVFILATISTASCTPKKASSNSGDNKVYNDDSEINMKSTERKSKMPFDTASSAPKMQRKTVNLETQ
jgi:hypothetical protein